MKGHSLQNCVITMTNAASSGLPLLLRHSHHTTPHHIYMSHHITCHITCHMSHYTTCHFTCHIACHISTPHVTSHVTSHVGHPERYCATLRSKMGGGLLENTLSRMFALGGGGNTHTHIPARMRAHTHTHARTHARARTHTHTHTHTLRGNWAPCRGNWAPHHGNWAPPCRGNWAPHRGNWAPCRGNWAPCRGSWAPHRGNWALRAGGSRTHLTAAILHLHLSGVTLPFLHPGDHPDMRAHPASHQVTLRDEHVLVHHAMSPSGAE